MIFSWYYFGIYKGDDSKSEYYVAYHLSRLLIGVDGGGTNTRAALYDSEGNRLGSGAAGPSNIHTDLASAYANIMIAVKQAFMSANLANDSIENATACLGLAGAQIGSTAIQLQQTLPFLQSHVCTDADIALQGAIGDRDGAVVAIGTGSVFVYRRHGVIKTVGGWGLTLGDHASAAWLGRRLLEYTLHAHDGILSGSSLTTKVLDEFNNDPQLIVEFAQTASPADFGRYSPMIFKAAGIAGSTVATGESPLSQVTPNTSMEPASAAYSDSSLMVDVIAEKLIGDGLVQIERSLDAILPAEGGKFCLLGGLAHQYQPRLAQCYGTQLVPPEGDSLDGAIEIASRLCADAENRSGASG